MAIYQYTARDENGDLVSDRIAFQDETTLRNFLRKSNLFVVDVTETKRSRFQYDRTVRLTDLIVMCRQFRTMVLVGLPMVSSLEALAQQTVNLRLANVLKQVARAVNSGRTVASAFEDHPKIFPERLIALVNAGETSGRLPETLHEAARQMELQVEIRQKTFSALMYPGFTLCATILTVTIMIIWIVPVFADIYKDLHATLPAPTLFLVALSYFLVHKSPLAILVVIMLIAMLRQYYRTPAGRYKIDDMKLRLPLFGDLILKAASGSLTASLAGLLESGVPLLSAMKTSSRVTGNAVLESAINDSARNVASGRRFSDELERTERFPPMVVRMLAMAETAGNLPEVLRYISESYVEEVQYTVRRLLTVIEPILVLVVAAVVGGVLICLYYPIFNVGNAFLNAK